MFNVGTFPALCIHPIDNTFYKYTQIIQTMIVYWNIICQHPWSIYAVITLTEANVMLAAW